MARTPAWYWVEFESMKISNYSSLARVVDPRYPTNFAILAISFLTAGALFFINFYHAEDILGSIAAAVSIGASVFLTWAIGREIDPEHELSAFAGLILVIPGFWILGAPDLVFVLTLLLLLRILNRTTGIQPKLLDLFTIIAFGSFLILRGDWIFGLLCAAALFLDSSLPEPSKQNLLFAGIMTALTIISLFVNNPLPIQPELVSGQLFFVIGSLLLFIPLIVQTRGIEVICDFQPEKVYPTRVQAGQLFSISAAVIIWLLQGLNGIINLLPLWSSIIAVSLAYITITLVKKSRQK